MRQRRRMTAQILHHFTTCMQGVTHAFYNKMSDKTNEHICSGCNQSVSNAKYYRHKIPGVCVSRMTSTATSNFADVMINDPEFFCENSVTECNAESSISTDEIMTGIEIVFEFEDNHQELNAGDALIPQLQEAEVVLARTANEEHVLLSFWMHW